MDTAEASPQEFEGADEFLVAALAQFAGFRLRPEELSSVAMQFRRACEIASPLLAFDLDEENEPGPTWGP